MKTSTFGRSLILSILIMSFLLQGCAAVNFALPVSQTVKGMMDTVNGVYGTFIFMNPNSDIVVLGWPLPSKSGGYAFVLMNKTGVYTKLGDIPQALGAQWKSSVDFFLFLSKNGWETVKPSALTPAIVSSVRHAFFIGSFGMFTPIVLFVPLTLDPMKMINPTMTTMNGVGF